MQVTKPAGSRIIYVGWNRQEPGECLRCGNHSGWTYKAGDKYLVCNCNFEPIKSTG